jgi:hypothetical protein
MPPYNPMLEFDIVKDQLKDENSCFNIFEIIIMANEPTKELLNTKL